MKISFCTTCANRAEQLRQTFFANLQTVTACPDVEWLIVGFNQTDGVEAFIAEVLPAAPANVRFVRERSGRAWHASIAKNVAHRVGTGDVLMNLDCDNYIGDAIDVIRVRFMEGYQALHMWSGILSDGTYGRVALDRRLFHALGGYDEAFFPMGYQDFDLLRRAMAAGARAIRHGCGPGLALTNTKAESIRHCAPDGLTWDDYNRRNRARSIANVAAGRLVANTPEGWLPLNVEVFHGGDVLRR